MGKAYRVRNWKEYNKSLVNRGSITFWFSEEVLSSWEEKEASDAHGNQRYSDMAIRCGLILRQLYRLSLRATEGLVDSLLKLMGLSLSVPDFSTLSRRGKTLKIDLGVKKIKEARHILVDSTGVQVLGEGEWKKLKHGESRYQLWRKLHLAMDANSQLILAAKMTESVRLDGNYLADLVESIPGKISQITGDGAYDKKSCYQAAYERDAKPVFPPQHDAIVQRNKIKKAPALLARDETILFINAGDRDERLKIWKQENNYHRRSLIETMMFRMKTLFGDQMRSRSFENQQTDLLIRCYAMNKITELGMPKSVLIN